MYNVLNRIVIRCQYEVNKVLEKFNKTFILTSTSTRSGKTTESSRSRCRGHETSLDLAGLAIKVIISAAMMVSVTIYLALLAQGIERQPGPKNGANLSILTYNCNGLGNQKKLKRLLMKAGKMVDGGSIVLLQETHLVNTSYLEMFWKQGFLSNCVKSNSAGVAILYNKKYNLISKSADKEGRQIIGVLENDERKIIVANAYFPNDHRQSVTFAEQMYTAILETQANYPDHVTFFAGDMNVCLASEDSLNRVGSQSEALLSDVIRNNNKIAMLSDAYRYLHPTEGFTWKRGIIYSRLDYVFVSGSVASKITGASVDWAFESSDHAAVKIDFTFEHEPKKGPGIVKVNTRILDDPNIALQIGAEIEEMMRQTDDSWNPHAKLEFLKVAIRSVFSLKVSEMRKTVNIDISETEEELNQMEGLKIKVLSKSNIAKEGMSERTEKIDKAVTYLKSKLANLRKKFSDTMSFVSRAKWFEYGEKSNKFFLNLNKARQNQKLISKIRNGEKVYTGQDEVSEGITEFYEKLYASDRKTQSQNDNFYENCPKLTEEQKLFIDSELQLSDLYRALLTCKESSPGPDGIPYMIYKKYWKFMGPVILAAWQHSLSTGSLPSSHLESVITILPKEGKDIQDIKNWRPITLSNCDSKIITKALSIKTSKVLNSIIDSSQTAYVPGRSVADNLRTNFFYKNHCMKNNIDAVLISLDAKKAFDSVDHKYIEETLSAYGFGPIFIHTFRTLYKNITARVLINGFLGEAIKIERGVKQGDALSCAIFILCIDPLLRNLNKNTRIKEVQLRRKNNTNNDIKFKAAAYADDISVICKKSHDCIQQVFYEYEKLTRRSGLELNADKTEILNLNLEDTDLITFRYNGDPYAINSVGKIKICGLYYSMNIEEEHQLNVAEKIKKLSYKIKLWSQRHLTMEGKSLIVKTFGLSQIIYNMQSYEFRSEDLTNVERIIFRFLWSTNDNPNGIDRIRRTIMKNEYSEGGMKITDVECLDRSLKLKQFIRANNSNHIISRIQADLSMRPKNCLIQEYPNVTEEESICKTAQETLNIIIDHNRELYSTITQEEYESDKNLIDEVSSINLYSYLKRKNRIFMLCMTKPLTNSGITSLGELTQAYEYENNEKLMKNMKIIISTMPEVLVKISSCYNEDTNSNNDEMKYIQIAPGTRKDVNSITVKELQVTLKNALKKTEILNVKNKLGIENFDEENITKLRSNCKNPKLRNIYFRMIHNDFYTHARMKKFRMTSTDKCPRCGEVETSEHLLWKCVHVQNIWYLFNLVMNQINNSQECVLLYENVFKTCDIAAICLVKMRIIQALIQIERPVHWNRSNIVNIIKDLINTEKYNACMSKSIIKFKTKWNILDNIQ
jgi:exonuclease III